MKFLILILTLILGYICWIVDPNNEVLLAFINSMGIVGFFISIVTLTTVSDVKKNLKKKLDSLLKHIELNDNIEMFLDEYKKFKVELEKTKDNNYDNLELFKITKLLKDIVKRIDLQQGDFLEKKDFFLKIIPRNKNLGNIEDLLDSLAYIIVLEKNKRNINDLNKILEE